ncbi:flagellar basal body-associated FliL family protein [Kiloniella laminariae]|uniref:Flagellar protein FliL n=1 Tax=Kiloniella laminariae TaxID=454162 RepID=A0ABT4LHB5_9PROT|nr:flagellar basal body-associated FliL family protein [Kiloniella laminariae]MCZ4280491.1 flagellar basal body-associated FliL family protein [Kiloniella laminariae]
MADESVREGEDLEVEARPKGGASGKKIVLFFILPLLLIIGGGAGAYFTGLLDSLLGKEEVQEEVVAEEEIPANGPAVFYDVPELLVNLSSSGNKNHFLKITISLELAVATDVPAVEAVMPRIVDNFQVYLRELRIEDLSGSAGIQRLREELLLRVNAAAAPVKIKDVLFQEMLVQ